MEELIRASLTITGFLEKVHDKVLPKDVSRTNDQAVWAAVISLYRDKTRRPLASEVEAKLSDQVLIHFHNIMGDDGPEVEPEALLKLVLDRKRRQVLQDGIIEIVEAANNTGIGDGMKAASRMVERLNGITAEDDEPEAVFANFTARNNARLINQALGLEGHEAVIPTNIDPLDRKLLGGFRTTETVLWTGQSGAGKSLALVHLAVVAARLGFNVVYFSLEGTRNQVLSRIDSNWTGAKYHEARMGNFPDISERYRMMKLETIIKKGGDIYVYAYDQFGSPTMTDMWSKLRKLKRSKKIHMVLIDYLELAEPGDGKTYRPQEERFRREKIARMCKNMAVKENVLLHTATQASNVPLEKILDPKFFLTRNDLSEFKGLLQSFDGHITINRSKHDAAAKQVRLFEDKLREHEGFYDYKIASDYARSRFLNYQSSVELWTGGNDAADDEDDE